MSVKEAGEERERKREGGHKKGMRLSWMNG